jgi:hypothetical protein
MISQESLCFFVCFQTPVIPVDKKPAYPVAIQEIKEEKSSPKAYK